MLAVCATTATSSAEGLALGVRMGASPEGARVAGYQRFTVWAKRDDGHLVSLHDRGAALNELPYWMDRGLPGGASPGTQGVSAVGLGSSSQTAFFIDEPNNRFIRYHLGGICAFPCTMVVEAPTEGGVARILTGHFVASARGSPSGGYRELLFATAKNTANSVRARLWVAEIDPGLGVFYGWQSLGTGESFDPNKPLATSAGSDPAWPFKWPKVFAVWSGPAGTEQGKIFVARWNSTSSGWTTTVIPWPNDDSSYRMFASAAGAEGNVDGYVTYLFCTRDGAPNDQNVYVAKAIGEGSLGFTWQAAESTAAFGAPSSNTYAVTAAGATGGGSARIDAFVLTNTQPTPRLLWLTHSPGGALGDFAELPADAETVMRRAPLLATPVQNPDAGYAGYSNLFFLGPIGTATRLYRQKGITTPTPTSNWANHGPANQRIDLATGDRLTEGGVALLRGRAVHVAMQANGLEADTAHRVLAYRSADDGTTWIGPTTFPLVDWETHHADPMVALGDSGTAWITALSGQRQPNCGEPVQAAVFYRTLISSGQLGNRVVVDGPEDAVQFCDDDCMNCEIHHVFDHPWVAIDPVGVDRIHMVWTYRALNGCEMRPQVRYATGTLPNPNLSNVVTLDLWPTESGGSGQLPVVTVGANHATYVATGQGICRINDTWDGCRGILKWGNDNDSETLEDDVLGIPGTTRSLMMPAAFSVVASPSNPNVVYYAFQRRERSGEDPPPPLELPYLDVRVQTLTYVPAEETFQAGPVLPLRYEIDWADQFMPVLSVSQDRTDTENVFVSFYDRNVDADDSRRVGDCAEANRCYAVQRMISLDQGLTFGFNTEVGLAGGSPPPLSDPANLPTRCPSTQGSFLGDYQNVSSDALHAFQILVRSTAGGPANTADPPRSALAVVRLWVSGGQY